VATLIPDLTVLASVEPDDARNRCRYVSSHFGLGVGWTSRDTERAARWDWPPDIWSRSPRLLVCAAGQPAYSLVT
jgi:hypothetical protein